MWTKLVFNVISGVLGLFLAVNYIPGVKNYGSNNYLILTGVILGLVNFFIKPPIKIITLPLSIITFGLFGLVINMALIWLAVDVLSPIEISGIIALFWTALIVWVLNLFFRAFTKKS